MYYKTWYLIFVFYVYSKNIINGDGGGGEGSFQANITQKPRFYVETVKGFSADGSQITFRLSQYVPTFYMEVSWVKLSMLNVILLRLVPNRPVLGIFPHITGVYELKGSQFYSLKDTLPST